MAGTTPETAAPGTVRQKTLVMLRHGEADGYASIDARLTRRGRMQARGVYAELARFGVAASIRSAVCSPLSRSLETLRLVFEGHAPLLASSHEASTVESTPSAICVHVTPLARERLSSWGDVGRDPAALLRDASLALDAEVFGPELARLPPQWWSGENMREGRTEDAAAVASVDRPRHPSVEPPPAFATRVEELRAFLASLPHDPILVVGHSVLFAAFDRRLAGLSHCGLRTISLYLEDG